LLNGIDNISLAIPYLKGKRVGILTNYTGLNKDFKSSVDILNEICDLRVILSPEHGLYGVAQAGCDVGNSTHLKTGLPVISLFNNNGVDESWVNNIDVLVYDIQDVGLRFYTYVYSLSDSMILCAKNNISVVVLDRYNPLGLTKKEGTVLERKHSSFVGRYPLPSRYALTVGELAQYFNTEENINCDLHIVPCVGLTRDMDFRNSGLDWVPTSPNCPTFDSVVCYIGTVLFEGTNMSEGRGTTKPFELFGAPWLRAEEIIEKLNTMGFLGVKFRYSPFTPTFSKFKGEVCQGIQLHITDYDKFSPFECLIKIIDLIRKTHKEFEIYKKTDGTYFFDYLLGTDEFRSKDFDVDEFLKKQKDLVDNFDTTKYEIYK